MSFFFYSNLFLRGNSRWGKKEGNLSVDLYKIFFSRNSPPPPPLQKNCRLASFLFLSLNLNVCVDALGVGVGDAQFVKKHKNLVSEKLV